MALSLQAANGNGAPQLTVFARKTRLENFQSNKDSNPVPLS